MNAKFLEKLITYRDHHRLEFTQEILSYKIKYQFSLVGQSTIGKIFIGKLMATTNISQALLVEARAARSYWNYFGNLLKNKTTWNGRNAQSPDSNNKLLNIGYHFLNSILTKKYNKFDIPVELGFFHIAQSATAKPLVYDCMEWLRPILVEKTFLTSIRKKKKPFNSFTKNTIPYFINDIKKQLEKSYFHKELGYLITLDYWIDLFLLKFINTVYEDKPFSVYLPSLRHENRKSNSNKK